ncbi:MULTISPECIES: methyl-accepting chemotaxis protein [Paenibacillus]|uniref:methyl-accepting chemotaxis protein n=1 Tax=Paenibacillus TaxID=44249 RepID=UPI001F20C5D3|nr:MULTISPECIES: methyl-accepting chemotaxis protein [Paenibacillus]
MKTVTKIISAFLIVALLLAALGVYSSLTMRNMNKNAIELYSNNLISVNTLGGAQVSFQKARVLIRDLSTTTVASDQEQYEKELNATVQDIEKNIEQYRPRAATAEEQNILKSLDPEFSIYKDLLNQGVQIAKEQGSEAFLKFRAESLKPQTDKISNLLNQLLNLNVQIAAATNDETQNYYSTGISVTVAIIIIAIVLSVLIGSFIARSISKPLLQMVGVATKVANGDLTEQVSISSRDEVGQLASALNRMVDNLKTLVNEIVMNSQSVAASSQQISASTQEIASTSTSQSAAAGDITNLFKELSIAIDSVANSAEEAADLSNDTVRTAREGGAVVEASLKGMQAVNGKMAQLESDSQKIGDIIEVIDDIAEQTNLLALNAAIEAARAGEQGRGFAVVADEVRKLAERSGGATKEITSIIKAMQENTKQSVQAVAESVQQSSRTGEAFERIIGMVNDSSIKVNEIAAACEEESAQAAEVMGAVQSIAASSEESAAASEETAATCQSLAQLSQELATAAAAFKTR